MKWIECWVIIYLKFNVPIGLFIGFWGANRSIVILLLFTGILNTILTQINSFQLRQTIEFRIYHAKIRYFDHIFRDLLFSIQCMQSTLISFTVEFCIHIVATHIAWTSPSECSNLNIDHTYYYSRQKRKGSVRELECTWMTTTINNIQWDLSHLWTTWGATEVVRL